MTAVNEQRGIGSVLGNFLRVEKPPEPIRQKTTLMNIRIDEKLRDDYRRHCFNRGTDMTTELIAFIRSELEKS
jgi:hypothetical protein